MDKPERDELYPYRIVVGGGQLLGWIWAENSEIGWKGMDHPYAPGSDRDDDEEFGSFKYAHWAAETDAKHHKQMIEGREMERRAKQKGGYGAQNRTMNGLR